MPLIEAFRAGWTRAFDYAGRSNRGDFWWFVLANLIMTALLGLLSDKLQLVYSLASLVPSLPLAVRRLRDIGKPWPWLFIGLVPIIGSIWLIVLYCQPSLPA